MKKTSKILSVVLVILMVISIIPITASAISSTSGTCGENLTWTYDTTNYTVTISGTGKMNDYWWNETPFGNSGDIKKVVIENGVTSIGEYAFYGCVALVSVSIPESITLINEDAFSMCHNLESITVDSNNLFYSSDEYNVLYNKEKTTIIKYPDGNTRRSYTIPESVTLIGKGAFEDSYRLSEICYLGTEEQWKTIVIKDSNESINESIKVFGNDNPYEHPVINSGTCGENLTWKYNSITRVLTISGTGGMYDYTYDKWDDSGNQPWTDSFREVVVEDGVTSIGKNAFAGWRSIFIIDLPDTLTTIGDGAFYGCTNLKDLVIPDSVSSIGKNAFEECTSLVEVIIGHGTTELKNKAFYGCSELRIITLPVELGSYNSSAFTLCENLNDVYYGGTEEQWNAVKITGMGLNNQLSKANRFHYSYCDHKYDVFTSLPTCTEQGYTTYTCECGDSFVGNYVDALGHNHTSEVTTPATHTTTGVMTYTCACGDSYTEVIAKLEKHNYESVVTAPTCTEQGYTTYTCECEDSYVADYVDALGHNYSSEITTPATHTATGVMTYTCSCGDTYTEVIAKLEKHNYESVITTPTCTERGYTTYTCECGDTYVDDYVDALGHIEETVPAVAPTCTETGLTAGANCSVCGETLTEQKELPANGHTPAIAVEENYVAPTCTENGSKDVVIYCFECDEEISRETVTLDATGHTDNDGDGYCDADNELLDPSVECDHACHKNGFTNLIWKIINFFNKLLGLNNTCSCGAAHY